MIRKVGVMVSLTVFLAAALLMSAPVTRADDDTLPQVDNSGVTSIEASPQEQRETHKMWTRRAMRQAQAADLMAVTSEELALALAETDTVEYQGEPGFVPGSGPEPGADALAEAAFPDQWDAGQTDVVAAGTAIPFTAFLGNYYSTFWKTHPYRMIGRLNYVNAQGKASWCTATPIGPDTIVTAAHCVFDTAANRWYSKFSFCPAYRNGNCPYRTFAWTNAWIPNGYINAAEFKYGIRYDVAVLQLGKNTLGKSVHQMVGYMARSWNQSYSQYVRTIGYPQKFYNGQYSWICESSTIQAGTDIMQMGCNSGPGHSGGPWIRGFGSTNQINNVMSYEVTDGPLMGRHMGAARFSSNNIVVLCNLAPGC